MDNFFEKHKIAIKGFIEPYKIPFGQYFAMVYQSTKSEKKYYVVYENSVVRVYVQRDESTRAWRDEDFRLSVSTSDDNFGERLLAKRVAPAVRLAATYLAAIAE